MASAALSSGEEARLAPTHRRFELVDSLRAIAALSVVVFHAASWAGVNLLTSYGAFTSRLDVGVTLFFLLSGFLLYRPHAVATLGGPAAPPLHDYALRRAFRILPAYWVALTVLAIWPGLRGVFGPQWWVYYGLLQSYKFHWWYRGLSVAWSLSVEIAFYAALPLLALLLAALCRRRSPRARAALQLVAIGALGAASVIFRFAVHRADAVNWFNSLPAHFLGFAVGMALAVASAWSEGRERTTPFVRWVVAHPGWCWALGAAAFVATALCPAFPRPLSSTPQSDGAFALFAVCYCATALFVMLPGIFGERAAGLPRRVLGSRLLSWVGKVSYGIFLWHMPLAHVARIGLLPFTAFATFLGICILVVPLSILLGWLSWRLVELPALRAARLLGARGILGAMARDAARPPHGAP